MEVIFSTMLYLVKLLHYLSTCKKKIDYGRPLSLAHVQGKLTEVTNFNPVVRNVENYLKDQSRSSEQTNEKEPRGW